MWEARKALTSIDSKPAARDCSRKKASAPSFHASSPIKRPRRNFFAAALTLLGGESNGCSASSCSILLRRLPSSVGERLPDPAPILPTSFSTRAAASQSSSSSASAETVPGTKQQSAPS